MDACRKYVMQLNWQQVSRGVPPRTVGTYTTVKHGLHDLRTLLLGSFGCIQGLGSCCPRNLDGRHDAADAILVNAGTMEEPLALRNVMRR